MNSFDTVTGYLEIIIGPMFSGKTSKLLEIYKQCTYCNIPVMVINHSLDKRYHNDMLSTHDQSMIPCHNYELLSCALNDVTDEMKVILINEGQFFSDLEEVVKTLLEKNKHIYICGLDGDFERKKFGQILELIPLCDKVTKLVSLCSICKNGSIGIFSKRITEEKEQTIIGSSNYLPVCRKCYSK